jgi:hypothetical protein
VGVFNVLGWQEEFEVFCVNETIVVGVEMFKQKNDFGQLDI